MRSCNYVPTQLNAECNISGSNRVTSTIVGNHTKIIQLINSREMINGKAVKKRRQVFHWGDRYSFIQSQEYRTETLHKPLKSTYQHYAID